MKFTKMPFSVYKELNSDHDEMMRLNSLEHLRDFATREEAEAFIEKMSHGSIYFYYIA